MTIPIKVLLFLLGGTAAAGTTAYIAGVFDPWLGTGTAQIADAPAEPPAQIAAVPPADAPAETPPPAAGEDPAPAAPPEAVAPAPADAPPAADATPPPAPEVAAVDPAAPAEPAPEPPAVGAPAAEAPAADPQVQPPTFDLVRVEGDGSLVIAGRAAPGSKVEIVLGSRILGSATAGPDGDFAIVLDEPLKPGDYQLVLRSTTPDNVVATSLETAVVSIPATPDGQVLALVEKPGEPSKLITVPEPQAPSEAAAPEAPDTAAPETAEAPAAEAEPPAPEVAGVEPDPAPEVAPPQPPAAAPTVAVEAVEIEGRKIFVAGVADPGRRVRAYANEILLGEATTSDGGRFLVEAERDLPVGDYIIRVDALGEDGVKVLARAAVPFAREPGETLAAVAPSQPEPAEEPAPAPAPETVTEAPAPVEEPPAAAAEVPPADAGSETPEVAGQTPADPAPPPVAEAPEQQAPPADVAEAPAAPPAEQPETAAEAPPEPAAPAETPPVEAAEVPNPEPAPPVVAEDATPPAADSTPAPETAAETAPAAPADEPQEPGAVAAGEDAAPPAESGEPAEMAEAPVPETMAPKLQPVDGAVIIRRGDTLWRISKRVYGRGVRYSTIYLANQQQIRDPDMIWPGQVFNVPDRSKEGEPADMEGLGEQAVKIVPYNG